ncbi:hypothetical protein D9M72_182170 [compost metagenome]
MQPAVAEGLGCFFGVVEVRGHGARRAPDHRAGLAHGQVAPVGIDDPHLGKQDRLADRVGPPRAVVRRAHHQRGALLHAVVLVEMRTHARGDVLADRCRQQRAREDHGAQRAQVGVLQLRPRQQHRAHGRDQIGHGDLLARDELQRLRRIEVGDDVAVPVHQAAGQPAEADAPVHREHRQRHVLPRHVEGMEHVEQRGVVVVADAVALGQAGGARGQVEIERVALTDVGHRLAVAVAVAGIREQCLVVEHPFGIRSFAERDHRAQPGQLGARHPDRFGELAFRQQCHRTDLARQRNHLHRRQPVVQRHADQARLRECEIDLRHLEPVGAKKSHTVALAQAECRQRVGQPVAARIGLRKAHAAPGGHAIESLLLREARGRRAQQVADDHLPEGLGGVHGGPFNAWRRKPRSPACGSSRRSTPSPARARCRAPG